MPSAVTSRMRSMGTFPEAFRQHVLGRFAAMSAAPSFAFSSLCTPSPMALQKPRAHTRAVWGHIPFLTEKSQRGNTFLVSRGFMVQTCLKQAEIGMESEAHDPERIEQYQSLLKGLNGGLTPRRSAVQKFIMTAKTKHDVNKAVVLVDQYKKMQFEFNTDTGCFLLSACIRAQHFEAAMAILQSWRRLRVRFTAPGGRKLLAAMAMDGKLDMMLSAHSLLLKAADNYDSQKTQQTLMRALVKSEDKRIADAFRELENSRLRGVKGHAVSYKLLLQAINDEMQAGGDGQLEEGQTLDGLRTKIKTMLKEDGLGSPPEDAIVQLLVFTPAAQPAAAEAAAPASEDPKAAEDGAAK